LEEKMAKEKIDFNKEYESRLKTITVKVKTSSGEIEDVNVPVCYAKATTHIRKPLTDLKELENMMHKTIECSDCPLFESCMELTKVDLEFSQVIILRDIKDSLRSKNGV
jgi:hypothetical protein